MSGKSVASARGFKLQQQRRALQGGSAFIPLHQTQKPGSPVPILSCIFLTLIIREIGL